MYGDISNVEEGKASDYLEPGVHEVGIKSLVVSQVASNNYTGPVADITFIQGDLKLGHRIFPFSFNPNFKYFNSIEVVPEGQQKKDYLAKHVHLFSKAASKEELEKAISGATSFEDYMNRYASKVTIPNGGKRIRILVVDKGGFSQYPMHKGGSAESLEDNKIVFNPNKHGPKQKDKDNIEKPKGSAKDDLPF